jgi:uncharacterized protein (DUF1697 family)
LRGINVGIAKRVAMAELRTPLNSGKVVFHGKVTSAQAAQDIEAALLARTGVAVPGKLLGEATTTRN